MTEEDYYLQSVEDSQNTAHQETIWGKPARDIITGISNNTSVRPVRAIWELVQNARDVVKYGRRAKISFTRNQDDFLFQHDGVPFTHKTIEALILQTSSKAIDNQVEVGQYGTGFLTTHKFGLRFELTAPLLTSEKIPRYYQIAGFEIDRSSTEKDVMRKAIKDQWEKTQCWGKIFSETTANPEGGTTFRYIHQNTKERQNVEEAFIEAPLMTPYVMLLNPQIESITFVDNMENSCCEYEMHQEKATPVEELADGLVYKNTVTVRKTGSEPEQKTLFFIESKGQTDIEPRVAKVTVILPVEDVGDGRLKAFQFDNRIPQLYIYLPLLGTEQWGINYMLHSSLFVCDRDSRDSLRLVGNGQNNDYQATANREQIALANRLIWQFVEKKVEELEDAKYLLKVNFKTQQSNEELAGYYGELQKLWRGRYETLEVVNTEEGGLCKVKDVFVLDEILTQDCVEREELLDAIYKLLNKTRGWTIPKQEEMVYWSRTINEWYHDDENPHRLRIEDVIAKMNQQTIDKKDLDWLHVICKYIVEKKREDLLNHVALIPNDRLKLQQRDQLKKPIAIASVVRQALDAMVPEEVDLFVHPRFEDIVIDKVFDYHQIKDCITSYLNNHNSDQNGIRAELMGVKKAIFEQPNGSVQYDKKKFEEKLYRNDVVQCILNLLKAVLPEESSSVGGKLIGSFEEFYGITAAEDSRLDKVYDLDERSFYNALIYDSLLRFTLLEDKAQKADWIKAMVKIVYDNRDSRPFLSNYQVYPDQNGVFKYAEWLKKQPEDTPDRALEIYDEIRFEGTGRSLKDELLCKDYNGFFQGEGVFDTSRHCQEVEAELSKLHYNLSGYKHLGLITEIIKHFTSSGEDSEQWRRLFPDIETNKGQLMFSTLEDQAKKDSLFSLIEIEDAERLQLVAKLAKEPKLVQIYDEGKKAVAILEREANDKDFKLKLGKYVEEILKKELNTQLCGRNLTIGPVKDVQNGQDMVVCIDDEIVYYIEVKSRWSTDKSVLMTTMQHRTSYDNKDMYALCAVDMVDMSKDNAFAHIYPEFSEVEGRIKVLTNIGALNERLKDATEDVAGKVHVNGGYQVLVSQTVIDDNKKTFSVFVEELKKVVADRIGGRRSVSTTSDKIDRGIE